MPSRIALNKAGKSPEEHSDQDARKNQQEHVEGRLQQQKQNRRKSHDSSGYPNFFNIAISIPVVLMFVHMVDLNFVQCTNTSRVQLLEVSMNVTRRHGSFTLVFYLPQ